MAYAQDWQRRTQAERFPTSFVCEWNVIRMCSRGTRLMPDVDIKQPEPERIEQTEGQFRQEREELRRIVDLIPQQIVVLNPEGKALYASRGSMEYTGLSLE